MKKKFLKIIVIFVFAFNLTACKSDDESDVSAKIQNIISTIEDPETIKYNKEVMKFICEHIPGAIPYEKYSKGIDEMFKNAEALSKKTYGKIVSEDDAIKKAKDVIIESNGEKYIEIIESKYVKPNEEYLKYAGENSKKMYSAIYYDEYDIWRMQPHTALHDEKIGDMFLYSDIIIFMRGSDGEVLAIFK